MVRAKRGTATPLEVLPRWDWQTVAFWSNIAYAMTGLEGVALMGAEIRDPARTLRRARLDRLGIRHGILRSRHGRRCLILLPPGRISELNGVAQGGQEAAAYWARGGSRR